MSGIVHVSSVCVPVLCVVSGELEGGLSVDDGFGVSFRTLEWYIDGGGGFGCVSCHGRSSSERCPWEWMDGGKG